MEGIGMKARTSLVLVVGLWAFFWSVQGVNASYVDLKFFTPNPASAVEVSPDGFSATLYEDEQGAPVSLENGSFTIPSNSATLTFAYHLSVAPNNEDYFDFYISDPSVPAFQAGGEGRAGGFTTAATLSFHVTGLAGSTVPVVFDLAYGWGDAGYASCLTISDVRINPVPAPGALLLFGSGILGLFGVKRGIRR
jgi:hypothetical protein